MCFIGERVQQTVAVAAAAVELFVGAIVGLGLVGLEAAY
jgi:hypothetical protein